MEMTPLQVAEIRKLTRRANRRIERATGGHKSYLESVVQRSTGGKVNKATGKIEGGLKKFSAATKGLTYEQAAMKLKQLDRFLGGKTTTIKGWKALQEENVKKANETLDKEGYDLTDEELAEILEQIDTKNKEDYYTAVNLVQAAKDEDPENWTGSEDQITEAILQKADYQEALTTALKVRNK